MGLFQVTVKLANPAAPGDSREVALLVDAGATLSWIPREVLQSLKVKPTAKLEFQLADGRVLERDVGAALFTIDGRILAIPVAFAEAGEEPVLGATALEALGFVADPVEQKLIPRRLLALARSITKVAR
jgi:clan AA aspartic protease